MRRLVATLLTTVVFLAPPAIVRAATITLLHVNDTHSHLDAVGPKTADLEGTVGGIARAATVITLVRQQEDDVLLLHAGDVFHGDFFFNAFFGAPELQLMQRIGFDAMAVGNHEFDLGPDVLAGSLEAAFGTGTLPLLSANLDLSGYPALETWIRPSMLKDVAGVRIGIFGMTTPDDPMNIPSPVQILGAGDPGTVLAIAGEQVAQLRDAGADVVICLSHLGVLYDQALAANIPGIDIIVGGHDHDELARPLAVTNPAGTRTLILNAGKHYEHVGELRFTFENGAVKVVDYRLIPVDASVPANPAVKEIVHELQQIIVDRYGDVYHTPLAIANRDISTTYVPNRPLRDTGMGNLITDALRDATGTDIAITANGLISEGIPAGPIVGADLFRPVSYGYDPETGLGLKIVTFDITGVELVKGLEAGLAYLGINEDFFLQVSGMRFTYDSEAPVGSRVDRRSVHVGGPPLDPEETYSVTTNEIAAALIPLMGVGVTNMQPRPELEYEVLKGFVAHLGRVHYASQGRIRDESLVEDRKGEKSPCGGRSTGSTTARAPCK